MEEVDGSNSPIDTKQLLLHIIGSVLGSDPRRVGSNPSGTTIENHLSNRQKPIADFPFLCYNT